ncbi:peroxiredoxin-like family protein [Flavobacterium sp. ASW18X]|uniref:peroxiredoxin-like family protein n=1 Tax=Flavobacterium sp. ASW18X TaxID=2572595 RepID=UPI0010ADD450|nr:peroxiredoxin-like family protein [Flavobacterium sp. ASW18X]TKD66012.1 AhpC/TSA family protein [Flavobacterium sp. ASW18X]
MLKPRTKVPELNLKLVNGTSWTLSEQTPDNFTMVIFYRGLHCPICKTYLEELQTKLKDFTAKGVNVIAISSDSEERAKEQYDKWKIADIPLGYNFSIQNAREWGLYVSKGIKDKEPDMFIEPGLFLIKPDGTLYSASIQTMPFARPEFDDLLNAIGYITKNDYPARGEA